MDINQAVEILLVEDNPSDVKLTLRALQKYHLANKVFVVTDGEAAADFLYKRGMFKDNTSGVNIKLIMLDLKLPKVDGLEILKMVKGDQELRKIPVVVLTSSQEEKDIIESYKLGVNSYIVKPLDLDQFIKAVSNIGMYWLLLNEPPGK